MKFGLVHFAKKDNNNKKMAVNDKRYRNVAAIFGVTGLVGKELVRKLLSTRKWKVYGVARKRDSCSRIMNMEGEANYHFISCDLLNPKETQENLGMPNVLEDVTHIFWVTWASQFPLDTRECFDQNKAMLSNVLNAILPLSKGLKHFSIQTGVKHYVSLGGPDSGGDQDRFYREDSPRVASGNGRNFYYGLEDLLQERLLGEVTWSIQRPGLILGSSQRTLYNFIGSLCVYGAICKHLSLPFVFGGTKKCWEEMYVDMSDARLVADQHIWAATNQEILMMKSSGGSHRDQWEAFNAINGEGYTWMGMWRDIGIIFGLEVSEEDMFSEDFVYSSAMSDKGSVWNEIVVKEGLVDTKMEDLSNWGFIDVLFRCPVKMLAAREKIDELGFKTKYQALDSVSYWIDVMRADRLVP